MRGRTRRSSGSFLIGVVTLHAAMAGLTSMPSSEPSTRTDESAGLVARAVDPNIRLMHRAEFSLADSQLHGKNPFDPDQIAINAVLTAPDGATQKISLFWYQGFARSTHSTTEPSETAKFVETLVPDDAVPPGWRLRWTPLQTGRYHLRMTADRAGVKIEGPDQTIEVADAPAPPTAFVHVEPSKKRYFQTIDGHPMLAAGFDACWPDQQGTRRYEQWLPAMAKNGVNLIRLWQGNAAFRTELYAKERLNYNLQTLWQLDRVMDMAAGQNIDVLLCMDFHGEFQTERDSWGHEGWWTTHAYNAVNGGPCVKPNDFFTDPAAAVLYRKRLRYLVARYGADSNLFAWEFFNEVDNIYGHDNNSQSVTREKNRLYPPDVVAWHLKMSEHLRSIDPYHHLMTTSLGSAINQPELWSLPLLDFTCWHWYPNWGGAYHGVTEMTAAMDGLQNAYGKPVLIEEFGTDGYKWNRSVDPELRGLHQAVWGGVFGGAAGPAMPWWWESIDQDNAYPVWKALHDFLPADFAAADWSVLRHDRPAAPAPLLGTPEVDGKPFDQKITLTSKWGKSTAAPLILNQPGDGDDGLVSGYLQAQAKPEFYVPMTLHLNAGPHAALVMHLNSVSDDPILEIRQNGQLIFSKTLPNKDGKAARNNEYNQDLTIPLAAGASTIEVTNSGKDWAFFDWIRLNNVEPATVPNIADADVPLEHYLIGNNRTRLLWVVDSRYSWPVNRTRPASQLHRASVTLDDWPNGASVVEWFDTSTGERVEKTDVPVSTTSLRLSIPAFAGDIAARITFR